MVKDATCLNWLSRFDGRHPQLDLHVIEECGKAAVERLRHAELLDNLLACSMVPVDGAAVGL